jgi:TonB family protein
MGTHLPPLGPAEPRGGREALVLPLEREGLDCRREAESIEAPAPGSSGARITEPRKTRHVAPDYPDSAKKERISGVVVLDAVISTTGCVAELEVVMAPDIRLAISALRAVAGWRYTPTLLGGTPVPTSMMVTVNFKL